MAIIIGDSACRILLVLLVGGGFLGLSGVLNAVLTIIRYQNALLVGYAVVAVLAFFMANPIVHMYEMMGAAVLYAALMSILCVFLSDLCDWNNE